MYNGTEHFIANGKELPLTMMNFWSWAYSDLANNINRSVLAEYIVATALEITELQTEAWRKMFRPYDMLYDKYRVEVKSAASIQSWDAKHPEFISFRIAPARLPDETGDYKLYAPAQRNSDVYVFCVLTALTKDQSPLDLDLWEFYVLPTKVLDEKRPTNKTITFTSLLSLKPIMCDYNGLKEAVNIAMSA